MNYRHAYHAGNFADVVKHAVLARLVDYLKRKEGAFRVIDTHAGTGLYSLASDEASRTGEWVDGIGRLLEADLPAEAANLLTPYLDVVRSRIEGGALKAYPGSPMLIRSWLRSQDRLSAFELHGEDFETLHRLFDGDFQARIPHLDGWLACGAHLPPKEKRGLVLIDPPFEVEGEFFRMADAIAKAHRRWPSGMMCVWYPLKHEAEISRFLDALRQSGIGDLWALEMQITARPTIPALYGTGLILKNPPYVLADELSVVMPGLTKVLARASGAGWQYVQLTQEDGTSV